MKLNVKGLVFVGFAAAVFASAAQAATGDDKKVTSLAYTEATYQKQADKLTGGTGSTIAGNSSDTNKFTTAAAVVQYVGAQPGAAAYTGTAPVVVDDHVISVSEMGAPTAQAAGTSGLVPAPGIGDTAKVLTGGKTWDVNHDTTLAEGTTNGAISVTRDGTTTSVSVHGLGSAAYTDSTAYATAAQGALADTAVQSVTTGTTGVGTITVDNELVTVYGLGGAAAKGVDTDFTNTASTALPTTAAVASYVTGQGYITNAAVPTQLSQLNDNIDAANIVDGVQVNGTDLTPDQTTKKVNITVATGDTTVGNIKVNGVNVTPYGLGTAAGANVSTSAVASDNGNLVTGTQVYNYIDTLNNGLNLPAADQGECGTGAPCALVLENGTVTWEPIAQAQ